MKARPILFNTPMVQAILEGRKTQTRRVIKPQPHDINDRTSEEVNAAWQEGFIPEKCPYGTVGDVLIPAINIPSLGRNYCADVDRHIWSRAKGEWRKLKGAANSKGYLTVTPAVRGEYKTRSIYSLVAEAFYGFQEGKQVRHLDGNQKNNSPENLDWGTQQQNWTDRAFHGRGQGSEHHHAKLSEENVLFIRASNLSQRDLAKRFGVNQSQRWCVKNYKTWREDYTPDTPNMPRWASRITLEITDIRVERLQGISEDDCDAEGVLQCDGMFCDIEYHEYSKEMKCTLGDLRPMYRQLWESIYGKGSWDANPWVWVIEFTPHMMNVDEFIEARGESCPT